MPSRDFVFTTEAQLRNPAIFALKTQVCESGSYKPQLNLPHLIIEHAVAEADYAHPARSKHPVDLGKDLLRLLQILYAHADQHGVETAVSGLQLRLCRETDAHIMSAVELHCMESQDGEFHRVHCSETGANTLYRYQHTDLMKDLIMGNR